MPEAIEEFLSADEEQAVIEAIRKAEQNTSGEIRVHLENSCPSNISERAVEVFSILKMYNTKYRNGVIIYIAVKKKAFAIYGDKAIHNVVVEDFWDVTKSIIEAHFQKGDFAEGITKGVIHIGEQLKDYFPWKNDDLNELPNQVSRS